jgi:hypothetical protein
MTKRKIAVLQADRIRQIPTGRHYMGTLSDSGPMNHHRLSTAQILVVEEASVGRDTGYFLYRYSNAGDPAGDTWHATEDEAMRAAADEYGAAVSLWIEVPLEVKDEVQFARQSLLGSKSE